MLTVTYAESHMKDPHAECRYAERHYAECRSAVFLPHPLSYRHTHTNTTYPTPSQIIRGIYLLTYPHMNTLKTVFNRFVVQIQNQ
jgi:hypothetical protein